MNLPKYEIIRQYVIDQLERHPYHDQPIMSERKMCEFFGTTRDTVRKALHQLVQEGILVSQHGRGMFVDTRDYVNTNSRFPNIRKIMLLTSSGRSDFYDTFYLHMIARICSFFSRSGNRLFPAFLSSEHGLEKEEILMYHPDLILWLRPSVLRQELIDEIRGQIPVCILMGDGQDPTFSVTMDYYQGGVKAAEWFIGQGMKHVPYFGASGLDSRTDIKNIFLSGWRETWLRHTGSFDEDSVLLKMSDFGAFFQSERGREADAFFCHSDVFPGFSQDYCRSGLAPRKIMVDSAFFSASDDISLNPELMIDLYPEKLFKVAADFVEHRLSDDDFTGGAVRVKPEIVCFNHD